jgi:hypothetical protein
VTELRPLLESSEDELERALLRAVLADLPSPSQAGLRDTALALGLAVPSASGLVDAVSHGSSLGHAGVHAASTAGTLGAASLGALGKTLLGSALVSFLALTTVDRALEPAANPGRREVRAASTTTPEPALPLPAAPASPTRGDVESPPRAVPGAIAGNATDRQSSLLGQPAPGERTPPSSHAPSRAAFDAVSRPEPAPSIETPANASLAAEIRLLDQTRGALDAGDTDRASALLDRYTSSRPSAVLAQEAALLRVRLLMKRGQRRAAAELARRIIHEHPESAHVDSLRQVAAEP